MAVKNSINNFTTELTVIAGFTGDSFVQFVTGSGGEFRIGIDETDDSFRISQGTALGTNDTFIMTDRGERTMRLNPAFLVNLDVTVADVTGDGTTYTIVFDSEIFDQGENFDGTTTFTAPVTGRYMFASNTNITDIQSAMRLATTELVTSNRTYIGAGYNNPSAIHSGSWMLNWAMLVDMDSGDTAFCTITVGRIGDAKVVDVVGDATTPNTYFSGYLAT